MCRVLRQPGPPKPSDTGTEAPRVQAALEVRSRPTGANRGLSSLRLIARNMKGARYAVVSPAQPFVVKFPTLEPAKTRDLHRSLSASRATCGPSENFSPKGEGSGPLCPAPARPAGLGGLGRWGLPVAPAVASPLRGLTAGPADGRARGLSPAGPGTWMPRPQDVRRLGQAAGKHEKASVSLFPGRARLSA